MAARRAMFGDDGDALGKGGRGGEEADLDITPMIDVTFLLLIFFMVSSTMQSSKDLDLPIAKHGVGVDTKASATITVKAPEGGGETPVILLGDGSGPEGTVDEIADFVAQEQATRVIIKADREVPHGFVQQVTKAVAELEDVEFYIGVREK